jgi:hypothetical protein
MTQNLSCDHIRRQMAAITAKLPDLEAVSARATYDHLNAPADPERASAKEAAERALNEAKTSIHNLEAALTVAERLEAERLAKVRAELQIQLLKKMRRELKALIDAAVSFSVATENLSRAWQQMTTAGEAIRNLLPPELRTPAHGFHDAMSRDRLKRSVANHLERAKIPGVPPSPFSTVGVPTLVEEMKSWSAAIMAVLDQEKPDA